MIKKDANKGRYGDTEIRNFKNPDTGKNEDQHVNAYEAYLLDNYKGADKLVSAMGSGTYNPDTGKKENWFIPALGLVAAGLGYGAYRSKKKTGSAGGPGAWWDYSFGKHGFGGYIGDELLGGKEEKELKSSAAGVVSQGLLDLEKEGAQYLGEEGFLEESYERKTKGMDIDYEEMGIGYEAQLAGQQAQLTSQGAQTTNLESSIEKRLERSGFDTATMNPMERINKQMLSLGTAQGYEGMAMAGEKYALGTDRYMLGLEGAAAEYEQSKLDYISGLKKQRTQLLSDYMQATGEPYGGSTSAFDTWLEGYEETV